MFSRTPALVLFSFLSCLLTAAGAAHAQTTYYVDDDGSGGCTSWVDACPDLQTALGLAVSGDQIWVAAGTYKPTSGTNRTATFQMITGVAIYGGFNGTETSLGSRASLFDQTILSGDIGTPDDNSDNSYHVVTGSGTDANAVLDGFTITGGNADGSSPHDAGGGMYNYEGSPSVTNCIFRGNAALNNGAGMLNWSNSNATVSNCAFTGNTGQWGAGMYNWDSDPTVTNCTFSGNSSSGDGGGMLNQAASDPTVTNCILWGDTPNEIVNLQGSTPAVTYSDVMDDDPDDGNVYAGTGNIDDDPIFVDADGPDDMAGTADDNLRLSPGSPAINAGTNTPPGGLPATDLDGNPRVVDGTVDMGAYEHTGTVHNITQDTWHITIQLAIDNASNADEIEVFPGGYGEAINFLGKAITVRSTGGPEVTTIDATGLGTSVVTCDSGEGPDTILDGFTITGGTGTDPGDGYLRGGGMYNFEYSSPTVTNCTFSGNSADYGGGMYNYCTSPTVTNCTFSGNSAEYFGGGMLNDLSNSTLSNCTFSGNSATMYGGGMCNYADSSPTVTNCTFSGNSATYGGAVFNQSSNPTVINCTFSGNDAGSGGGMRNEFYSSPMVTNCTFTGNTATSGGGMDNFLFSSPVVVNCILWGDTGGEINNDNSTPAVTYSDVQGGYTGDGNIVDDPIFVDADGPDDVAGTADDNLRLSPGSPAINAGTNTPPGGLPATDLDGNPRIADGTVDMGAYERGATVHNITQDTWHTTIQLAIDNAFNADEIEVVPGTCHEAIDFLGKGITVRSTEGAAVTIIDATGLNASVVTCASGEGPDTVLDGFTITGGTGNVSGTYCHGGGMYNYYTRPTVSNCTFSGNTADRGAGLYNYHSNSTVTNCTFSGNTGDHGGGLLNYRCSPTVTNCTFSGNTANYGGGVYSSHESPTVTNCTFSGNSATVYGGGMNNLSSNPRVTNCTFIGNTCPWGGAGVYSMGGSPTVTNCTFSGNTGAGMYNGMESSATVTNCILWGDTEGEVVGGGTSVVTYTNVQGGYTGTGNLDDDPLFVRDPDDGGDGWGDDPDTTEVDEGANDDFGDLRLTEGSPCIDAGDNAAVTVPMDLDGNTRIWDGDGDSTLDVDMGAYEFGSVPEDCNENSIPDLCDLYCDALGGDCHVPECGQSSDDNGNGIPDECDCPELVPPAAPEEEAGCGKTRYISMVPGNAGQQIALRVTLTTMPADPPYYDFTAYEGTHVWVGEPIEICENSGQSTPPPEGCGPAWVPGGPALTMWSANLQATQYCHDFGSLGTLHVTDCEIVPGATYTVQAIHCDCDPGNEENYSDPLTINTSMWGDICNTYDGTHWTAPNGTIDVTLDVTACLEKFKNAFGAPIKARANVDPNVPGWKVNISTDVTQILDAFKGQPYPFAGPGTCPP